MLGVLGVDRYCQSVCLPVVRFYCVLLSFVFLLTGRRCPLWGDPESGRVCVHEGVGGPGTSCGSGFSLPIFAVVRWV